MKRTSKNDLRIRRKRRIRVKVSGTKQKPRLCIFKSLRGIYVQVIDDERGHTLASADLKEFSGKNNLKGAAEVGKHIAQKCAKIKITEVVFDRGGYKYHGKIKTLAEVLRKEGLKF